MNPLFPQFQGSDDPELWKRTVHQYDEVISSNASDRVAKMSDEDLVRYSDRYNTPTSERTDILRHMYQWGGFNGMLLAGGIIRRESSLFFRLLNKKPPLAHTPPRSFGKSWYELFEQPGSFECTVSVRGRGRRGKDIDAGVWLLNINDGPWECISGSDAGQALIAIEQQWMAAETAERSVLWPQVLNLLTQEVSLVMRFGLWEETFNLRLSHGSNGSAGTQSALATLTCPASDSIFRLPQTIADFPMTWQLQRITKQD